MDDKGKTTLVQNYIAKRNAAYNDSPITCLPLVWNLLTSVLAEKVYAQVSEKNVPDEQKGCRKDSQGTKHQLLIGKQFLKHCKKHHQNLANGWINYKKACDMVPNRLMKMVGITDNIVNLFENSKEAWRTEMTACNESLDKVDFTSGIFQEDFFLTLLFVVTQVTIKWGECYSRDKCMGNKYY